MVILGTCKYMKLHESIRRILKEDRKHLYIDRISKLIVDDTIIDVWYNFRTRRGDGTINYPFFKVPNDINSYGELYSPLMILPSMFSDYCQHTYGLNREETKIVWQRYREIMIEKIENILKRFNK